MYSSLITPRRMSDENLKITFYECDRNILLSLFSCIAIAECCIAMFYCKNCQLFIDKLLEEVNCRVAYSASLGFYY